MEITVTIRGGIAIRRAFSQAVLADGGSTLPVADSLRHD